MIDDQGAGGSSKSSDTKPGTQRRHASSLPETLLPHLYDSPRDSGSQIIAPLMVPDLPNGPIRSSSPNRVQSLPIRSQILDQSLESHRHSYSHIPPLRTLQPPRLSPRHTGPSPGVEDVFDGDVGVLLQPDMPIRPLGDPYVPLRRSPGFYQVQRRSGTEARAIDTSRGERTQTQPRDHRIGLEQGRSDGPLRDPQRQVERFPPHPIRGTRSNFPLGFSPRYTAFIALDPAIFLIPPSLVPSFSLFQTGGRLLIDNITVYFIRGLFYFTESRPPITYPINPFEEQQRLQRQRLQVHHQPQPQQPQRFRQLLSGPGYQGSTGTSSSSQAASTSQSRTIWSFSSELYSEGKSEVEPLRQGSLAAEHPAIGAQGAVPGRKKAQRSSAVKKEPGAPTVGGGSTSTSTGTTTSTRKRPSSKVSVACNFCRGEWFCLCLVFMFEEDLIRPPIAISAQY